VVVLVEVVVQNVVVVVLVVLVGIPGIHSSSFAWHQGK
jgi:hypothetical protein